ncbi:MAG: succinylglutamate desuccinylase/aspartoacylase family protein [Acidobacteria bacterium]|nr:succinylglutamate desuccinylase/aspartoacylase family protein [Acidobacteriota bacterium]
MSRKRQILLLGFAFLLTAAEDAVARGPFTVGTLMADPGKRVSGFLEVPAGVDAGTRIPVTLLHGANDGPVLALIAGTHGYEYAPIIALQKLRGQIDPAQLSGTVILVHVANLPSFLGRTIYYSPVDGKNLNRVYPGKVDGTVSERIAYTITTEIIERAHAVADLHCGDGNEALRPYTYWMKGGNATVDEGSRQMALAFGLDHIVIDTNRPADPQASVYTANTAITRGKPAITTETGGLGDTRAEWVGLAERGVWNLLRHFKMLPGEPARAEAVVWLDTYEVLRSPETGIFYAAVQPGHTVARGALLGRLTDFFGNQLAEIRAPLAGVVNYVVATPPVSQGEPLAMVSHILAEEGK